MARFDRFTVLNTIVVSPCGKSGDARVTKDGGRAGG